MASKNRDLEQAGFAKLLGPELEYVMRKYECILGRKSKAGGVDVELGSTMSISRKHAKILFNFDKGCFELEVYGKNGVTVNGELIEPGMDPVPLRSQTYIQVANDVSFFFLLPKSEYELFPPNLSV